MSICLTAAAAKSLQSCPTLCDPIDGSPPGSPIPLICIQIIQVYVFMGCTLLCSRIFSNLGGVMVKKFIVHRALGGKMLTWISNF